MVESGLRPAVDPCMSLSPPLAALSPGAGHPRRQWPASNFARIARWWVDTFDGLAVIVGGPGDEKTGAAIARDTGKNIINLAGKTTLRQTGEILRYCHIFVGNDSGPMHLAAAANLPLIEISIFTKNGALDLAYSPLRFHPRKVPYRIISPEQVIYPCTDVCNAPDAHCIKQIPTDAVIQAIISLHHEIDLLARKEKPGDPGEGVIKS